jgi:uncharacterized protein
MSLSDQIQRDLVAAMRQKDTLRLSTLRMVKTALKNREVEKRAPLSDEEGRTVLQTLVKQRREAADQFRKGARPELADKEEAEMALIQGYLPSAATDEEIAAAVETAITETGAQGLPDMGRVMKSAMASLASKTVDGSRVSAIVKQKLGTR